MAKNPRPAEDGQVEPQGNQNTTTRVDTFTIAGQQFTIPDRYSAGHVINEAEASRLNQDIRENVRNNFAEKVKKGEASQAEIDAYLQSYQFGVRQGGGGRTGDPVEAEARALARKAVEASIRKRGEKPADYSKEQIGSAIDRALEKHPQFREQARAVVAARQGAAIDVLSDAA